MFEEFAPGNIDGAAAGGCVEQRPIRYKIINILAPLLLLAVAFSALYSAINWLLVITTGWIPIDREVANLWLPFAIGAILVGIFISPRLRVLRLSEKRNVDFLYQMAAVAVLVAPTCFAQYYLTTASGALAHVESATQISSAPSAKYYMASTVCVDRSKTLIKQQNEVSGRRDEYLDFKLYLLVPVCATSVRPVWIGLSFDQSMNNNASDAEKDAKYKEFQEDVEAKFNAYDFERIQYFEFLDRSGDRRVYEKSLSKHGYSTQSPPIILIPHVDAFEDRNGENLPWAFKSFCIAAGIFVVLLLIPSLDQEKLGAARRPRGERTSGKLGFWSALIVPRRDHYGLPILLDINVAVYLAMALSGLGVLSFQIDDLRAWGANYGPDIQGLGAYRLISSQFIHGGAMHLLANTYGLVVGGVLLSPVIRKSGLITSYLVCGLVGSIASDVMHPEMTSIGASGAIMGLWGIALALALLGDKRIVAMRVPVILNCLIFGGLTLAQGAFIPGIDNAAHVGGLATGIVIGAAMFVFSWGQPLKPIAQET